MTKVFFEADWNTVVYK